MSVKALSPDYEKYIDYRDAEKNFHGNRVVYLHWEEHLSYCSALAFPLPPDMPFAAFIEAIVKPHYAAHPEFAKIDWNTVVWMIDGLKTKVDVSKSLAEHGVGHKSLIRFWTPDLNGYKGSAS
jgi:phenol hydroxylase P4 protein